MPRPHRLDRAGTEFHITNRGLARRTIFESRADYRYFLANVARAVRRGQFVVLAYALMPNHFHLLVRSEGGMSDAMQRIQVLHSRRFNRLRGRDGPLFGSRFFSKRIRHDVYRRHSLRYVHENPVLAGLAASPGDYPWCSAALVERARMPRWIDPVLLDRYRPLTRPSRAAMEARKDLIAAHLRARDAGDQPALEDLSSPGVRRWLDSNARRADGAVLLEPVVGPATIELGIRQILSARGASEACTPVPGGQVRPTSDLLTPGLLRTVAACDHATVARRLAWSRSRVRRAIAQHLRCMRLLSSYAALAAEVVQYGARLTESTGVEP